MLYNIFIFNIFVRMSQIINNFTVNKLIFCCNELSCKRDSDRIQKFTEKLKNRGYKISKNTEIILIGNTKKDIDNFEKIDKELETIEEIRKEFQNIIKPNNKDKKLAKDFNEISI